MADHSPLSAVEMSETRSAQARANLRSALRKPRLWFYLAWHYGPSTFQRTQSRANALRQGAICAALAVLVSACADPGFDQTPRTVEIPLSQATHAPQIFYADTTRECGFNIIETVHTRTYANQGDIELWCRDPADRSLIDDLDFKRLPTTHATTARSRIRNVEGYLYDTLSKRVFNGRKWVLVEDGAFAPIPDYPTQLVWHQVMEPGSDYDYIQIGRYYKGYMGYSVFTDRGYHGSFDGYFSAITAFEDDVIVNFDRQVKRYDIPMQTHEDIHILNGETVDAEDNWIYDFFPYDHVLIYGSAVRGSVNPNGPLTIYDGETLDTHILPSANAARGEAREYYSYLRYGDDVLIGTYPSGYLVNYSPDRGFTLTDSPENTYDYAYREAQSLTLLKGNPLVGMYPWGEIFERVDGAWTVKTLFDGIRDTGRLVPFDKAYRERFDLSEEEFGGAGIFERYADIFASLPPEHQPADLTDASQVALAKAAGIDTTSWGLRITHMVVMSGEFCVGTGNMAGALYDADVPDWIPKRSADWYGNVFCADVPGHILVKKSQSRGATVQILGDRIVIRKDGEIVQWADW